ESLAELLDIYPTLLDLCGIDVPAGLQGKSLVPVLANPNATVKNAAFTQHPRPAYYKGAPEKMGYSVRTARWRYTEWIDWKSRKIEARELYDYLSDAGETVNLAGQRRYRSVIDR